MWQPLLFLENVYLTGQSPYYLRKFPSKEELTNAIKDYIEFYNAKRYQLKLKCMTPM